MESIYQARSCTGNCILAKQVAQPSERLTTVEEELNQHSSNSSLPPSSNGFGAGPTKAPQKDQFQGKQNRPCKVCPLIAVEHCDQVQEEKPEYCPHGKRILF
jgi:hypothetical protein